MAAVPNDLIREILSCLPVKSLIRFRCVSLYFCALIDSPCFAKEHLNRSIIRAKNNYLIVLSDRDYLYSANMQGLDQPSLLLHRPISFTPYLTKIIGSANGLLCVYDLCKEIIVIWNPATRKYHQVPKPQSYNPFYGFGYDSVSDDYKILRIDRYSGGNTHLKIKAQLYSLRSNSWHNVDQEFPATYFWHFKSFKFAGSALHWMENLATPPHLGNDYIPHEIVAFDLTTNKYRLVANPVEKDRFMCPEELGELKNCLSLTCYYNCGRVDVWLMKNYGVRESWSKMFSIRQAKWSYGAVTLLTYSERGDKILLVIGPYRLFWYNPDTGAARQICGYEHGFGQALICGESMISPSTYQN